MTLVPANAHRRSRISRYHFAHASKQRGAAFLLFVLIFLVIGGGVGFRGLNRATAQSGIDDQTASRILAQSKDALLAWAVTTADPLAAPSLRGIYASRPGILPYPDLYGPGTSLQPIRYDGRTDLFCAYSGWTGTQTLLRISDANSAAVNASVRCLGKLPWKTLGMDLQAANPSATGRIDDPFGRVPWYAVSSNLVDYSTTADADLYCPRQLNHRILAFNPTVDIPSNSCGSALNTANPTAPATYPFPWLKVRDQFGNLLSNRVAAVIILPGPITTRQPGNTVQSRTSTATPSQFLDTVVNLNCVAGLCDNSKLTNSPLEFIQCVPAAITVNDPRFTQPYTCNDRLIYITIDELMKRSVQRVASEFQKCVREYQAANLNRVPWPDTDGDLVQDVVAVPTASVSGYFTAQTTFNCSDEAFYWQQWQLAVTYSVNPAYAGDISNGAPPTGSSFPVTVNGVSGYKAKFTFGGLEYGL